jgi:hypothetical protein
MQAIYLGLVCWMVSSELASQEISHVAGLKWGSACSTIQLGFKRCQSFRAVICRLSRTLLATVHSVQENGLYLGVCDGT